ncbi:acyl carrier protein [Arcanobacterium canis]
MDQAMSRVHLAFKQSAPEIEDAELIPEARLAEDLGLDTLAHWQVASAIERIARVELLDSQIDRAITVGDFVALAVSDAPLPREIEIPGNSDEAHSGNISYPSVPRDKAGSSERAHDGNVSRGEMTDDLSQELAHLADLFKR